jgi:hypothetical protein
MPPSFRQKLLFVGTDTRLFEKIASKITCDFACARLCGIKVKCLDSRFGHLRVKIF